MRRTLLVAICAAMHSMTATVQAQEWRAGAQVGRIQQEALTATSASDATVVVALTRVGFSSAFALSGTVPLEGQPRWASASGWKRITTDGPTGVGLDLALHGFMQRETVTYEIETPGEPPKGRGPPWLRPLQPPPGATTELIQQEVTATGGGGQAAVLAFARRGDVRLQARGGIVGRAMTLGEQWEHDAIRMFDMRASINAGVLYLEPELQQWGGGDTYGGSMARAALGRVDAWAAAGQWLRGGSDAVQLAGGIGVEAGHGVRLDASYRSDRYEPLYSSVIPASASVGMSIRLGRSPAPGAPVPASYRDGLAVIRLAPRDTQGAGAPRIAGDFSEWKPIAMTLDGDVWTATVPVEPGVYNYAFVSEDGEWYVPASTPGRRSDGMGGYVAVLVVAQ